VGNPELQGDDRETEGTMQNETSEFRARLLETLDSLGLCATLAAEIEDHLTLVTYEKGAVIFLRGSAADLLFWPLKGFVKLYLPLSDSMRILVDLARPGDLLAFVNNQDSSRHYQILEAQALTKCSIGLLTYEHLTQLLNELDHQTAIGLLEQLNAAWSTMFERYIMFLGSSFRVRLELVLNRLAARVGIEDERGTLLMPQLAHEDLAEMIGSSRPMVSKLIADMTQEGLLAQAENRHLILRTKARLSMPPSGALQPSVRPNGVSKKIAGGRTSVLAVPARRDPRGPFPRP
jgi:CRP/FNR family cyclic AMP-dependent transcriptional regulator